MRCNICLRLGSPGSHHCKIIMNPLGLCSSKLGIGSLLAHELRIHPTEIVYSEERRTGDDESPNIKKPGMIGTDKLFTFVLPCFVKLI